MTLIFVVIIAIHYFLYLSGKIDFEKALIVIIIMIGFLIDTRLENILNEIKLGNIIRKIK